MRKTTVESLARWFRQRGADLRHFEVEMERKPYLWSTTIKVTDRTKSSAGYAHRDGSISLNPRLQLEPLEQQLDTFIHEVAHLFVGIQHHHDRIWYNQCIRMGGSGDRCHDLPTMQRHGAKPVVMVGKQVLSVDIDDY